MLDTVMLKSLNKKGMNEFEWMTTNEKLHMRKIYVNNMVERLNSRRLQTLEFYDMYMMAPQHIELSISNHMANGSQSYACTREQSKRNLH